MHRRNYSTIIEKYSRQHTKTFYALETICRNHLHNANQETSILVTSCSYTKRRSALSLWHHRPCSMTDGMDHSKSLLLSTQMHTTLNYYLNSNHITSSTSHSFTHINNQSNSLVHITIFFAHHQQMMMSLTVISTNQIMI